VLPHSIIATSRGENEARETYSILKFKDKTRKILPVMKGASNITTESFFNRKLYFHHFQDKIEK
jgi:hypothetical protein